MTLKMADAIIDAIGTVTEPLHARITTLEAEKASVCDLAKRLETRVRALEQALGLKPDASRE